MGVLPDNLLALRNSCPYMSRVSQWREARVRGNNWHILPRSHHKLNRFATVSGRSSQDSPQRK
ncbi:Adenylosuccinate synthetase, partial [Clarias magur]